MKYQKALGDPATKSGGSKAKAKQGQLTNKYLEDNFLFNVN